MLRQFILQPNEDKRLQIEGRYLVITQASGPLELTIGGTTPITVDEKDRIHLRDDSPNDRAIRIKNISGGTNFIELHTSDLLVDKRTGTDIKNEIQIAEDQRIGIDPQANIVQAVIQNPIKIAKNQCVGFDPKKNQVEVIRKTKAFNSLPTLIFEAAANAPIDELVVLSIPQNKQRDLVVLTANSNNLDPIWVGGEIEQGLPLLPGDRVFIEGQNEIPLAALTDHVLYVAEVVWTS